MVKWFVPVLPIDGCVDADFQTAAWGESHSAAGADTLKEAAAPRKPRQEWLLGRCCDLME